MPRHAGCAAAVRGDYGMRMREANTPRRKLLKGVLTLWGVPADGSHDPWRNAEPGGCTQEEVERNLENSCGSLGRRRRSARRRRS
jgi:hypothetical protein